MRYGEFPPKFNTHLFEYRIGGNSYCIELKGGLAKQNEIVTLTEKIFPYVILALFPKAIDEFDDERTLG